MMDSDITTTEHLPQDTIDRLRKELSERRKDMETGRIVTKGGAI